MQELNIVNNLLNASETGLKNGSIIIVKNKFQNNFEMNNNM